MKLKVAGDFRAVFGPTAWLEDEVAAEAQLLRCLRHGARRRWPLAEERRGGAEEGAECRGGERHSRGTRWGSEMGRCVLPCRCSGAGMDHDPICRCH
jgi:hypothetical protein